MENALLVGLSRQVALKRELDVIANNLANAATNGFKREAVLFEQFVSAAVRDESFPVQDQRVAFVLDRATRTDFAQGSLEQTGNSFDVAIEGDGFFVVETPRGERYTRNGAFALSTTGELVTADGHRVLGEAGPIVLDPADTEISIARDGTVSTLSGERGKLRIVQFDNASLSKEGLTLYSASPEAQPQPAGPETRIVQGMIEKSNVRPVAEIGRLIEVTRAYTTLSNLMGRHDELRRSALEKLAEVPA